MSVLRLGPSRFMRRFDIARFIALRSDRSTVLGVWGKKWVDGEQMTDDNVRGSGGEKCCGRSEAGSQATRREEEGGDTGFSGMK